MLTTQRTFVCGFGGKARDYKQNLGLRRYGGLSSNDRVIPICSVTEK